MSLGEYLYCIIRCPVERTFEDVAALGDSNTSVHTIPYNGLAAVVSDSPVGDYQSSRVNLLAHQRVQERVMREFTLLPVRFGTVANGVSPAEEIRTLLEKRSQEFAQLLAEMEGKVELGLKALWRAEKAILEEVLAQSEAIRRLLDSLQGKSPQATYYDRLRLGEMLKEALDRERRAEAARLLAPLRQMACRTVENQVLVDRMVVNAAFLVDQGREAAFDQAVEKLDEELGRRVTLKYVGPIPPYNFVNITVNWQEL